MRANFVTTIENRNMGIFAENIRRLVKEAKEGREEGRQEGREEGLQQGELKMIAKLVTSKFGVEVSEQLMPVYSRLNSTESRDRFFDWVILSENAKQLMERIRSSSKVAAE